MTRALPAVLLTAFLSRSAAAIPPELARRLVTEVAPLKEGENVLIQGGVSDMDFMDDLAVEASKLGARPIVTIVSERRIRRFFDEVPAKYDQDFWSTSVKVSKMMSTLFLIDWPDHPGLLRHVPPERRQAMKSSLDMQQQVGGGRIKRVEIGNDLYPTASRAAELGMARAQLEQLFWNAVNVDYHKLGLRGRELRSAMVGKELVLTHPNGTRLRVGIEGKIAQVNDGVISDDELKKGGAASLVFLPAGEVYITPVKGTAEGKIVIDHGFFEDSEIFGLVLTVKAGKVVSFVAAKGEEVLRRAYDSAPAGKEQLSAIDVGINPELHSPTGEKLLTWIASGNVTVSLGRNAWAGGDIEIPFGVFFHQPGCTVKIDERTVVNNGELSIAH